MAMVKDLTIGKRDNTKLEELDDFHTKNKNVEITGMIVNIVSGDRQVEDIECFICFYKGRIGCYWAIIQFDKFQKLWLWNL